MGKTKEEVVATLFKNKVSFAVKLAKFGDQKQGDRRAIIIPKEKVDECIKIFGSDQIKITLEKI
jgi:hypothetical protein